MESWPVREAGAIGSMVREGSGGACASRDPAPPHRATLLRSRLAIVENLCGRGERPTTGPEGYSAEFQVCLPYRGLFVWHVGGDDVVSDANQVLFVSGGEAFRVSDPLPGGYGELIVTPTLELLSDLVRTAPQRLPLHPLFRRRCRRADLRLQVLRARFLHYTSNGTADGLAAEELVVALLRAALATEAPARIPSHATRRLVGRTKEFVEAHLADPIRLRDVAHGVGASPAYLTDVFRRFEGLPLHQYVLQARLARALVELPHADDLTALALDLGFSSHSHFAASFRRAFACTPSDFRDSARPRRSGTRALAPRRRGLAPFGSRPRHPAAAEAARVS
jgi:AraC family transcriptional regulator